jgi:hypothetical protein
MKWLFAIAGIILSIVIILLAIHSHYLNDELKQSQLKIKQLEAGLEKARLSQANKFYDEYKRKVGAQIEKNISSMVERQPDRLGGWFVTKIEFIEPHLVYVEYEDGHYLYEAKFKIIIQNEELAFKLVQ